MQAPKEILAAALGLPPDQRQELVGELWASLDDVAIVLSPEWEAEIDRRVRAVDSGELRTVPGEEAMARLKRRFGAK